ncbi:MAG: cyclic nucleotide-binding domain-containing protein [Chloroflexota bacterium]|nr:cyclic nucleotide-binding domain-containing protein [Chloroflexota bacterium]MDH5244514.1 cyclic nucleotide-binding domain-containing protein [Chloroflexota bacterium]
MGRQRFESSVTAISWIPSEAISGPSKIPFELGVTHYDTPPPDHIDDLEQLRVSDRFREANELRAFIEVEDGRIVDHGHLGKGHIGATTVRVGPAAIRFPAVHLPDIQPEPEVGPDAVRFTQTVGGRMGLPTPRPVKHRPFVQFWPSIAWTTLALTLHADGTATHELVGASPFPRHWIYDDAGDLAEKSGTIDFGKWFNDSFGDRTPWGEQDSPAIVAAVESALERSLSSSIMRGDAQPAIRSLDEGETLVTQGDPGTDVFLILDGIFVVEVDGDPVVEIGPGAVVGERAALEGGGRRTASLIARTRARVASVPADALDANALGALSATRTT